MDAYPQHGGQLRQIAERFRIPAHGLLDFSANINPDGPPTSVLAALREALEDPSVLTEYPDLKLTDLKESIASYARASPHNLIVANGFVPLLTAALQTLKIRRCLLPVPAFVEYRNALSRAEIAITTHPLSGDAGFRYDPDAILAPVCDAILLANPQNPSGVCHDASDLRDLITKASVQHRIVLLDEAFIDYLPEHSLTHAVRDLRNLIVFRSVTKFHAVPGMRVAYAVAHPQLARAIADHLPPWPVTTLAARAVTAALEDSAYALNARSENLAQRSSLARDLTALGLRVYPAAANFLLFQLPSSIDPDSFWQRLITHHGIVLRACANFEGLARGHFRVAVRKPPENTQLIAAIARSLSHDLDEIVFDWAKISRR